MYMNLNNYHPGNEVDERMTNDKTCIAREAVRRLPTCLLNN